MRSTIPATVPLLQRLPYVHKYHPIRPLTDAGTWFVINIVQSAPKIYELHAFLSIWPDYHHRYLICPFVSPSMFIFSPGRGPPLQQTVYGNLCPLQNPILYRRCLVAFYGEMPSCLFLGMQGVDESSQAVLLM